jgi:hypothetical protein
LPLTNAARWRFSGAGTASALLIVAAVCGHVLLALPRTAIPDEAPALHLSAAAVAEVVANDRTLAAHAPSTPAALEVDALLLEKGESERQLLETSDVQAIRLRKARDAVAMLTKADGAEAVLKLRARAVERMQDALDLKLPSEQVQGVLGGFPTILREARASRDGVIVAPQLVVRTLYKVRWNVIMALPPLYALQRVERLAYNGWFALHVATGPIDARLAVLRNYQADGGFHVNEARGALGYAGGDPAGARVALSLAEAARPSYRLRNWIRAAKRAEYTMATERVGQAAPHP